MDRWGGGGGKGLIHLKGSNRTGLSQCTSLFTFSLVSHS